MDRIHILLGAALLVLPLGGAVSPNPTCDADWSIHHYTGIEGPGGWSDGNLADCDGDFDPADPWCAAEEVAREDVNGDGLVCEAIDYDGHHEWSRGGALLAVESGDGWSWGTIHCYGEVGHHSEHGPIYVYDVVLGAVPYTVSADDGASCGDFQADVSMDCFDACALTFAAGTDGAYLVTVHLGTAGLIIGH